MPDRPKPPLRVLTLKQLRDRGLTYSRQHIGRLEAAGKFPKRIKLGENGRIGWFEYQVDRFLIERAKASGAELPPDFADHG
ncbi:MAG: helix-turn-helix transcriptional regulator [Pseudomonadota bacterium]